jgi:hypothetical protein
MNHAPLSVATTYRRGANSEAILLCHRYSDTAAGGGYPAGFAGDRRALGPP